MIKRIAVIGIGTLGGYLCSHIAQSNSIEELVIIDNDIVEGKNVFTSIYTSSYIGEYKVDALSKILMDNINIVKMNIEYVEGKTKIPKCDLVLDCRDIVCSRLSEIDIRLYISGRVLIVDCRKNTNIPCTYNGEYIHKLTNQEINKASFYACQLIESEYIHKMIKNNLVQRIDLDILPQILNKAITTTLENKFDMVYESSYASERLQCIEDTIKPILETNKNQAIDVYVGEKPHQNIIQKMFCSCPDVAKTKYAVIPVNTIKTEIDVMQKLSDLINLQPGVSNYIVTVKEDNGRKIIELLEETGAA